ncbi:MAG: enoyl-CoA hydratase/isomerase family protein [Granulosicoccus sp.]
MSEELLFKRVGDTGEICFNRPHARNAITFEMYESLASICTKITDGRLSLKALVLTGSGDKAFAAGTEISCFENFNSPDDGLDYERTMDRVLGLLESVPIPTVAAIRGACTGGGAAIAACCDIRIASSNLRYGFPIARTLGNCLSIDNLSRQVELLGAARTKEILLTSRLIELPEALSTFLVNEASEDPVGRAYELCNKLQKQAPLTMAASKEGIRRIRASVTQIESDDLIVQCYGSQDFRIGMEAFLAKKTPKWTGQ